MNAAGIDVSSKKSTVAVLRPFGEVVKLPFDVTHSAEGLAALVQQLKSIEGETRVVMEHTGRYYEPVAQALHTAGFYVSAVNPLLLHGTRLALTPPCVGQHLQSAPYRVSFGEQGWFPGSPPRTHEVSCCGSPSNYQAMLQPSACSRIVMKRR